MLLDYKRQGKVRQISRAELKPEKDLPRIGRSFTKIGEVRDIPIGNIKLNPHQPRREMDPYALQDLAISIMEYGLLQPIAVRQISPFDYELIAGERRLTACKNLGMSYIPAVVMAATATDSAVLALVENIQRENLSYMEEAEAFHQLLTEHGLTQEELADRLGKSQSAIANKVRILKLTPEVRRILADHHLTERHARALLRLPDAKLQLRTAKLIAQRGLNVAKTEELIEKMIRTPVRPTEPDTPSGRDRIFRDVRIFSNTIRQAVDLMRKSGIDATANKTENENFIEYTIVIPKER